jgi:hypothetical protein
LFNSGQHFSRKCGREAPELEKKEPGAMPIKNFDK